MKVLNALRAGLAERAPALPSTVYSPEERNRVLARFEGSNRAAARRFLGREALFLEPPPAPDAPYWRFPELASRRAARRLGRPGNPRAPRLTPAPAGFSRAALPPRRRIW